MQIRNWNPDLPGLLLDMIERIAARAQVERLFRVHPAVAIEGPRQCGKTTLARMIAGADATYFDLESNVDRRIRDRTIDRGLSDP